MSKTSRMMNDLMTKIDGLVARIDTLISMQKLAYQDSGFNIRSTERINDWVINLPDHLRKTAIQVVRLGRVTADDVSKRTQRARAVESEYLNQLHIMGHIEKERVERKAVFFIRAKVAQQIPLQIPKQ